MPGRGVLAAPLWLLPGALGGGCSWEGGCGEAESQEVWLGGLSQAAGPSSGWERTGGWESLADPKFSPNFVDISTGMKALWSGPLPAHKCLEIQV